MLFTLMFLLGQLELFDNSMKALPAQELSSVKMIPLNITWSEAGHI